ncbi:hypothetical protein BDC45DRAFT_505081 [Circinella umbellata]|nr:hypothetical protein BDC45DRAFT_505081 [Circinella umbellata]
MDSHDTLLCNNMILLFFFQNVNYSCNLPSFYRNALKHVILFFFLLTYTFFLFFLECIFLFIL